MSLPAVIIGGGISGLSAAYYLRKRGIASVVINPSERLGGMLQTDRIDGCTVETGADSWLAAKPWARELATELGLGSEVLGSNDIQRGVKVLKQGKLVPFPRGMQLIVPKDLRTVLTSSLFGLGTKLRMVADRRRTDIGERPDRSVAAFVRDHFGQGAVDYLAEPLLSGIYGGDPEDLSAVSVLPKLVARETRQGSLTREAAEDSGPAGPVFESMRGGLGQLIQALHPEALVQGVAEAIQQDAASWQVRVSGKWLDASHVIIACPTHQASSLVGGELGGLLKTIRHSSAHIVAMAFRGLPPLRGFGLLVPKKEGLNLTAVTFVTNKFEGRAPAGLQLVRAFFREPVADPVAELQSLMRFKLQPVFLRNYQWPQSLPQYEVGHRDLIVRIEEETAKLPGLHLVGNAYHGVGIPDCVKLARNVASRVAGNME